MAPSPPKRRKIHHGSDELGSANSESEFSNEETAKQPAARHKKPNGVDESALYSGGLYNSSLFKLQIDEMLAQVQPNYEKRMPGVDDALRRLKTLIETIEDRKMLPIADASKSLQKVHKVVVPFPDPKPDPKAAYKVAYERPSKINVVGSYALKTIIKSDDGLSVDMVVTMPASIFQEKDFLNYRYFYKRAYYLACITAGLQDKSPEEFALKFDNLNGNSLQPVLVVRLNSKKSDAGLPFDIHIIPAAPEGLFPKSKLQPTKNSIRPKQITDKEPVMGATPSPFYNSSLQSDSNYEPYLKLIHSCTKQASGFKEACILGRIWLRQRGFGSSISNGGFGNFEWAALSALLLRGGGPKGHGLLSSEYSSYQMFKAIVKFLSTVDLAGKPMAYDASDFVPSKSDSPVFYDGPRGQNIFFKMSPWSYKLLREEAAISVLMLNDTVLDQFDSTFIIRSAQPLQQYDCLVRVPIPTEMAKTVSCDHQSHISSFSGQLFSVLQEGLTDRVKLIDIRGVDIPSWSTKTTAPTIPNQSSLLVAVLFDPANADRLVDHGPPAEEKKKAAKFQKFWGEKADLRRFKDGSILESVVWSPGSTYAIFREIVTYLVKQHCGADISKSLTFIGEEYEKLLPSKGPTNAFETLRQAFSSFEKHIRELEGLPLQLRQLSGISAQLRYSDIEAPLFNPRRPLQKPADVLIQFEGSGRWPDDITAIQRTKIAFLLKIGNLLEEFDDAIKTSLGLENEDKPLENCAFLDIVYESGASFRLRIHNDREQTLLDRQVKDKLLPQHTREDAALSLSTFRRTFIQLPLHSQSIATHCTRFPFLSSTIRLVKLWFDRHMLSRHISDELIELFAVRAFLQPYPWRAPSSAMTGFFRTLLFLSRWDWRSTPLIVDFTGAMTGDEVAAIKTRLEAWRKIDPGMSRTVLIAASNHDPTGTAFTEKGPSKLVAARMTVLARSACKLLKDQGPDLNPKSLLASSTADYDFVVHLAPKFAAKAGAGGSNKPKFKNIEMQSDVDLSTVGFQPVHQYLSELEKLYGTSVVFFHSTTAGSSIAGLWNPQATSPRVFKVILTYGSKPAAESEEEVELDKASILAEIARLGGDMVSRVEVHR